MIGFNDVTDMFIHRVIGVYGLCYNDKVQYIGKSTNIHLRIRQHITLSKFSFNRAWMKRCSLEELSRLESDLIYQYNPPFNKQGKRLSTIEITPQIRAIISKHLRDPNAIVRRY